MSFPWNITNPGLSLEGLPTAAESAFLTNITGIAYELGDILYHDGTNLVRLESGIPGQLLGLDLYSVPEWQTVSLGGGAWGSITGTLSAQTDLQTALNGKANSLGVDDNYVTDAEKAALHTHSNISVLNATTASFTTADETKLDGIAAGAEVNVNPDWNAVSGDAQILNKPTISGTNTGDQNTIVGITGTLAQFNTAVSDAELARTDAANTFTGVQTFSNNVTIPKVGLNSVANAGNAYIEGKTLAAGSVQGLRLEADNAANIQFSSFLTGDSFTRFSFLADGTLKFGNGTVSSDTNLYRSAANTLKTDDAFIATGTITGSNLSGTNTGDQTTIAGITGTKAQFDTAVTDGNFLYVGDAPTTHSHIISDTTGLQTALDNKLDDTQFSGLSKITVGTSAPGSPAVGDLWVDTN